MTISVVQQEQMAAKLAQKRSEVKSLTAKLETAQRQLSQRTADAELANQQSTLTMTQAQYQISAYGRSPTFGLTHIIASAALMLTAQPATGPVHNLTALSHAIALT